MVRKLFYNHLRTAVICLTAFQLFLLTRAEGKDPNPIVVAQDGTGNFTSVQKAIDAVPNHSPVMIIIRIKKGVYHEKIVIPADKPNIHLMGDNAGSTIITNDDYSGKDMPTTSGQVPARYNTFNSYTMLVKANDFTAENLTIANSAGRVGQAVALHVEGDRCVFKNCRITGNQDTIFATRGRELYEDCYIEGTTDFIFGDAAAVFWHCTIQSLTNSYITAASTPKEQAFGFLFFKCDLTCAGGVSKVTLGRPWRSYASVVFAECQMGQHIIPQGWNNWGNAANESTARYAEYSNNGPGSVTLQRATWAKQLTSEEFANIKAGIFQRTDNWEPEKF